MSCPNTIGPLIHHLIHGGKFNPKQGEITPRWLPDLTDSRGIVMPGRLPGHVTPAPDADTPSSEPASPGGKRKAGKSFVDATQDTGTANAVQKEPESPRGVAPSPPSGPPPGDDADQGAPIPTKSPAEGWNPQHKGLEKAKTEMSTLETSLGNFSTAVAQHVAESTIQNLYRDVINPLLKRVHTLEEVVATQHKRLEALEKQIITNGLSNDNPPSPAIIANKSTGATPKGASTPRRPSLEPLKESSDVDEDLMKTVLADN